MSTTDTEKPRLISAAAFARMCGKSRAWVWHLEKDGHLTTVRIGKSVFVRAEDAERLITHGTN